MTTPQDLNRAADWLSPKFANHNFDDIESLAALLAAEREPLGHKIAELERRRDEVISRVVTQERQALERRVTELREALSNAMQGLRHGANHGYGRRCNKGYCYLCDAARALENDRALLATEGKPWPPTPERMARAACVSTDEPGDATEGKGDSWGPIRPSEVVGDVHIVTRGPAVKPEGKP